MSLLFAALLTASGCSGGSATSSSITLAAGSPTFRQSLAQVPLTPTPSAIPLSTPRSTQSTGTSTPVASITVRLYGTATVLTDGRVLIAGGEDASGHVLATAELWDPTTGKSTPTGAMSTARESHTATILGNGQVLIVGGFNNIPGGQGTVLATAELYDPASGVFTRTGSLTTARYYQTASLLNNGEVLVAGGSSDADSDSVLGSAELYDPGTGKFTRTGSMKVARQSYTATVLRDGRVLVAGGDTSSGSLSSAELYDPATGTFRLTGSMTDARRSHTATLLTSGDVLIAGGGGPMGASSLASAELFDPSTGRFAPTGSMVTGRFTQTAVKLPDGRVLILGGLAKAGAMPLASVEAYDPKTGQFAPAGSMAETGCFLTVAVLDDGRVLIAGGDGSGWGQPLATAEVFRP